MNTLDHPTTAASTAATAARPKPAFWPWPGLVFVLFAGQLAMAILAVTMAHSDRAFAIEPDYYRKALHWDEYAAQLRTNQSLGWTLDASIADEVTTLSQRRVEVTLRARDGAPLDDAAIRVELFHHAHAQVRTTAELTALGDGRYFATPRMPQTGAWELRFDVSRGSEQFTSRIVTQVGAER